MKNSKKMIEMLAVICVISFIVYTFFFFYDKVLIPFLCFNNHIYCLVLPPKIQSYISDISLGIFTGAIISLLISYRDYENSKNKNLDKLLEIIYDYNRIFCNIPFFYTKHLHNSAFNEYKEKLENYKMFYKNAYLQVVQLNKDLEVCFNDIDFFDKTNMQYIVSAYKYLKNTESYLYAFYFNPFDDFDAFTQGEFISENEKWFVEVKVSTDGSYVTCANLFMFNSLKLKKNILMLKNNKLSESNNSFSYSEKQPHGFLSHEINKKWNGDGTGRYYSLEKMLEDLGTDAAWNYIKQNEEFIKTKGTIRELNYNEKYIVLTPTKESELNKGLNLFWTEENIAIKIGDVVEVEFSIEFISHENNVGKCYLGSLLKIQKIEEPKTMA